MFHLIFVWIHGFNNDLISKVGSITCSLAKILKKENMGINLQNTWEEDILKKKKIGIHL
jgi:hypothetical protein